MIYLPANNATIYALGWRRPGDQPWILYGGTDRLEALEALSRAVAAGTVLCGKVIRRDRSELFVIDWPVRTLEK